MISLSSDVSFLLGGDILVEVMEVDLFIKSQVKRLKLLAWHSFLLLFPTLSSGCFYY